MTEVLPQDPHLSEAQRLFVERLRERTVKLGSDSVAIPPTRTVRDVPLTPDQARILFLARMFPGSAEYNQSVTFRFAACPEPEVFARALTILMERHDALRLRIYDANGEPVQELCDRPEVPVTWHDVTGEPEAETERLSVEIGNRYLQLPFDFAHPPLFRVAMVRLPRDKAVAILVCHHLIADGRSLELLSAELVALLADEPLDQSPPIRFIDYAVWRASRRDDAIVRKQVAYWREQLSGELPVLDLPSDRPPPAKPSRRGHTVPCRIPAQTVDALRRLAEAEGTTLYVVLLSVYKTFLMRMTRTTDILVGAPFLGRGHPAVEKVVGMFVNTAVLRTDLGGDPSFRSVVRRVRDTVLGALDNCEAPFDQVVAELNVPRDIRQSPLFQTMFSFGGLPASVSGHPVINDLPLDSEAAKWDLTIFLDEFDTGVEGYVEYAADLFDHASAVRFVDIYLRLCATFAAAPEAPIRRVRLLSDVQRSHIVADLNPYNRPADRYTTMVQPFEEQVRRTPDAIALEGSDVQLSYSELNAKANRLARELRDRGVREGSFVALCMERCFDVIVALFAIAKSGAAYVPLDPDLPAERIAFMLADVDPALVLAHTATRHRLAGQGRPLLLVDADSARWSGRPACDLECPAPFNRPVHLLYTSGSTGRPKAVVYPINAALAEIFWLQRKYPSKGEGDANIFITSYGFDVSIWEIFWTLYFGARLIVPRPGEHRDPQRLIELIDTHRLTTMFLTPGMLDLLLDMLPAGASSTLRWMFCGGAPISARLRDRFHERLPSTLLINCYGPTEAGSVTDMVLPRDPGNPRVPLGRPAANYRLYVLDDELEPCPIGVPGEVFLAGEVGIGLGYHGRPALTAERFLPDPFGQTGGRMYRTGDLCRYRPDGVLEHLGRIDRQIKLRGMRIEPAEIEAVLCEHEAVAQCHVLIEMNVKLGQQLLAFVVLKQGRDVEPRALLAHARKILPRHMVPVAVAILEALPTNVNNKMDTAALAAIASIAEVGQPVKAVPPIGPKEEVLFRIFRDLLGIDDFGVEHSFFDLGGHSLLIFKLIAACEAEFGYRPSVADVFSCPTVRELAARLDSNERGPSSCLVPLAPRLAKPIVVFVHAAGGSVLPFVETARALGQGLSIWGLQAADPDDMPSRTTIEAIAPAYVAEVDGVREMSPLILIGWSMGGCIAFEMARNWRARGIDVASVLLLDTWVPPILLDSDDQDQALAIVESLDVLGYEGIASADAAPSDDVLARMDVVRDRNVHAFAAYRPPTLDVDIDYLRARDSFPDATVDFPDAMDRLPDRGWGRFARSIELHLVGGDHFSMVGRQHAGGLAKTIQGIVAKRLVQREN